MDNDMRGRKGYTEYMYGGFPPEALIVTRPVDTVQRGGTIVA